MTKKVRLLLPVWGESYIKDFLEISLPSILAGRNLPALAQECQCRFVFLVRENEYSQLSRYPSFHRLQTLVEIEYIFIDDLIVAGNYSATLTLALDRGIRKTGKEMLQTYFLMLMADYVMADGSLTGLMRLMEQGYSGICAGNFQILKEDLQDYYRSQVDPVSCQLQIKPREMLKRALECLHPVTVAGIINQNFMHNFRANRFFYRHDSGLLAGKFYLLHLLCVKPETENYRVGSPVDYSFVPEMCPSGKIAVINDSDDYFVVELQSRRHELDHIAWGPHDVKKLASALAEWTTRQHRNNIEHTFYYHENDLCENEKKIIEFQLNQFKEAVNKRLRKYKEKPYYDHPYWRGIIKAFNLQQGGGAQDSTQNVMPFQQVITPARKLYYGFFGVPPAVFPWHYRWKEYTSLFATLKHMLGPFIPAQTIVLYDSFHLEYAPICRGLMNRLGIPRHYHLEWLFNENTKAQLRRENTKYNKCILVANVSSIDTMMQWFPLIKEQLTSNGKIFMVMPNLKNYCPAVAYDFQMEFISRISLINNKQFQIVEISSIHNHLTLVGESALLKINRKYGYSRMLRFLHYMLLGLPGTILVLLSNCLAKWKKQTQGHCTHVISVLNVNANEGVS